jgi:hypothetical protein
MKGWKGVVASEQKPSVLNGGETVLKNLMPGVYGVARAKQLRLGDMGIGAFCDRRTITVEAGEVTAVDFVRRTGQPIEGEVVGLLEEEVPGAFIYIKSVDATGDPYNIDEWKLTIFDFLTCDVTGRFKTARILPGSYTVIANAYKPEPQTGGFRSTGIRLPDFIGTTKVTVPKDGQPLYVRIEIKPRPSQLRSVK